MNHFELSDELADQIRFAMENQEEMFLLDTVEAQLVRACEVAEEDPGRFLPLPEWASLDGFNLMEGFTATLRNPLMRTELHHILQSGKGVFRLFKDALRPRPEIERLWFRYKDREMRRRVIDWYNDLREVWGLERLAEERESGTDELVHSDFSFHPARTEQFQWIAELDREALVSMFPSIKDSEQDWLKTILRGFTGSPDQDTVAGGEHLVLVTETAIGDLAGFCWGIIEESAPGIRVCRVMMLLIMPEYRGIGLGKNLFRRFQDACKVKKCSRLTIQVPEGLHWLLRYLELTGFTTLVTTMCQNLDQD